MNLANIPDEYEGPKPPIRSNKKRSNAPMPDIFGLALADGAWRRAGTVHEL